MRHRRCALDFDSRRSIFGNDAVGWRSHVSESDAAGNWREQMKREVIRVEPLSTYTENPPARIFINVAAWPGHFDIEIDCITAVL
jgi:hypothetical protein